MVKLNPQQSKKYLSEMRDISGTSLDELITDSNQQQSKSRVRQSVHSLIDIAASKRKRILVCIGD